MAQLFDNETLHGKLFISYPMIESIRDVPSLNSFLDHKVSLESTKGKIYKELSTHGISDYVDPRKITNENWKALVKLSIKKSNYITNGDSESLSLVQQSDILDVQIAEMDTDSIYVLCSFPMFVHHQKGEQIDITSS